MISSLRSYVQMIPPSFILFFLSLNKEFVSEQGASVWQTSSEQQKI